MKIVNPIIVVTAFLIVFASVVTVAGIVQKAKTLACPRLTLVLFRPPVKLTTGLASCRAKATSAERLVQSRRQ
jgi:hypothetical protein